MDLKARAAINTGTLSKVDNLFKNYTHGFLHHQLLNIFDPFCTHLLLCIQEAADCTRQPAIIELPPCCLVFRRQTPTTRLTLTADNISPGTTDPEALIEFDVLFTHTTKGYLLQLQLQILKGMTIRDIEL